MTVMERKGVWQRFDGDQVLMWRAEKLCDAGFTDAQAAHLALADIDLHDTLREAARLFELGCPPEYAFDILAN